MIPCSKIVTAIAHIQGGQDVPDLIGTVKFYQQNNGVWIVANIKGLPPTPNGFFGFHIHEGTDCGGETFANTKGHYNPQGNLHPNHSGDLPPLLSVDGNAIMAVKTNRFTIHEIIGRTVVIHSQSDDFTSQPAGNAGTKIACGVIRK
jgi:Cu-Zn family superoxide dismutase